MFLTHRINEGIKHKYRNLHQWNFFIKEGNFKISDGYRTLNASEHFRITCHIEIVTTENNHLIVKFRKKSLSSPTSKLF